MNVFDERWWVDNYTDDPRPDRQKFDVRTASEQYVCEAGTADIAARLVLEHNRGLKRD